MATQTSVEMFSRTISETNRILGEIQDRLMLSDTQHAYHALRATLFALRDRLPAKEAIKLGQQLPTLVRGIYYDGFSAHDSVEKWDREGFLALATEYHDVDFEIQPEEMVKTVWDVLCSEIDAGMADKMRAALPKDIVSYLES